MSCFVKMFDSSIGIFILWLKNYSCWNLLLKTVISWLSSFDDLKDFKHTPWYWSLKMMRLPIQFETVFKTFLSHSVFCSYGWTSFVVFFETSRLRPTLLYHMTFWTSNEERSFTFQRDHFRRETFFDQLSRGKLLIWRTVIAWTYLTAWLGLAT